MKLSELLFSKTIDLWDQSASKPFVIDMAKGTLDSGLYKQYMLQDYLYLKDYIGILKQILDIAEDEKIRGFLTRIIDGTVDETERVHLAGMKRLGITDEDITKSAKFTVISEYVDFMRKCVEQYGLLGGVASLLQCSWVYAYISDKCMSKYSEEIAESEYRSWFEAYSCKSYIDTNQIWIDLLDELGHDIDDKTAVEMCRVFERCARFENELWDRLYSCVTE